MMPEDANANKPPNRERAYKIAIGALAVSVVASLALFMMTLGERDMAMANLAAFSESRVEGVDKVVTEGKSTEELIAIIENQRERTYGSYALEAYFCTATGTAGLNWSDSQTAIVGSKIFVDVACSYDDGEYRIVQLQYDTESQRIVVSEKRSGESGV